MALIQLRCRASEDRFGTSGNVFFENLIKRQVYTNKVTAGNEDVDPSSSLTLPDPPSPTMTSFRIPIYSSVSRCLMQIDNRKQRDRCRETALARARNLKNQASFNLNTTSNRPSLSCGLHPWFKWLQDLYIWT